MSNRLFIRLKKQGKGLFRKKQPSPAAPAEGIQKGAVSPKNKRRAIPSMLMKNVSLSVVIAFCVFLILMPFVPQVPYYVRGLLGKNVYNPMHTTEGSASSSNEELEADVDTVPSVNTLRLPAIGIDVPIVEGATDSALDRGAWHRPGTGTPESGGNTVVTGHRFKYLPPSNLTFYHLDKVKLGDWVIVYWNGKRYDYQVEKITVVNPNQIEVEAETAEPQLTLYTCTPLWTAKQRLVIVAKSVVSEDESGAGDEGTTEDDGTTEPTTDSVDLEKIGDELIDE